MSIGDVNKAQPCFYQRQHFYLKNTSLNSLLAVTSLLLTIETFPRCYYGLFARKPENTFCVNILCSLSQVFCTLNYITTSLNKLVYWNNFVPKKTGNPCKYLLSCTLLMKITHTPATYFSVLRKSPAQKMSLMCDFLKDFSDIFSLEFDKCTKQH